MPLPSCASKICSEAARCISIPTAATCVYYVPRAAATCQMHLHTDGARRTHDDHVSARRVEGAQRRLRNLIVRLSFALLPQKHGQLPRERQRVR